MPLAQALQLGNERDLDLVEVAPNVSPPVCRLLDYGKFRYEQAKNKLASVSADIEELSVDLLSLQSRPAPTVVARLP